MILLSVLSLTNERRLESAWLFGTTEDEDEDKDKDDSPVDCDGSYAAYGDCIGDCGDNGFMTSEFVRTVEPKNGGAACPTSLFTACTLPNECVVQNFGDSPVVSTAGDIPSFGVNSREEWQSCNDHNECINSNSDGALVDGIACRNYAVSNPETKACIKAEDAQSLCNDDKKVSGGVRHFMTYEKDEYYGKCVCDETLSIVINDICFGDAVSDVKNAGAHIGKAIDKQFKLQVYRKGDPAPTNDGSNVMMVCSKSTSHSWALFPGGSAQSANFKTYTNGESQDAKTYRKYRGMINSVAIQHVDKGGDHDWLRVADGGENWFEKASPTQNNGPMHDEFLFNFHRGNDSTGEEYMLISCFANGKRWFLKDQDDNSVFNRGEKFEWTQFPHEAERLLYFRVI
jgi:hypothetical protein